MSAQSQIQQVPLRLETIPNLGVSAKPRDYGLPSMTDFTKDTTNLQEKIQGVFAESKTKMYRSVIHVIIFIADLPELLVTRLRSQSPGGGDTPLNHDNMICVSTIYNIITFWIDYDKII